MVVFGLHSVVRFSFWFASGKIPSKDFFFGIFILRNIYQMLYT